MKKIICALLCIALLAALAPALAVEVGDSRVVLGADLSESQITKIYGVFGMERGTVRELTITNPEERELLAGGVDPSLIGSRSISSIFIRLLDAGEGYQIVMSGVTSVTEDMYKNALITAGITDVELVVTSPVPVSGTAALAGIYKAWQDMTGVVLSEQARSVSTAEFALTRELTEQLGSIDVPELVSDLKLVLDETREMTDAELTEEIRSLAAERGLTLNDTQLSQLVMLCRSLEKLDDAELSEKVRSLREKALDLGETAEKVRDTAEKVSGWLKNAQNTLEEIGTFFRRAAESIKDFFSRREA